MRINETITKFDGLYIRTSPFYQEEETPKSLSYGDLKRLIVLLPELLLIPSPMRGGMSS